MKFASIYLQNYIGIYNGMGLSEIYIDFTKATHRTIVIRGDNGSGKSTIMKSLSVFPDGNECFIPEKPAKKIIQLIDGITFYEIMFVHGVKSNRQREVTKAYITKSVGGAPAATLNENGNVSSFKDILYDELGLDPNFESLSQLSTDDRGIADKKPADRKRFVNSILNNLEVYNDIYKSLTKRSSSFKNLINSIVAKLGTIGDPATVLSNINGIETKINELQDAKDKAVETLASQKARMELLDPDGSVQSTIDKVKVDGEEFQKEYDKLSSMITSARLSSGITLTDDINIIIKDTQARINSLNIDNQIKRGQVESFLRERESESNDLSNKIQRLESFEQEWRYESICDSLVEDYCEKEEIEKSLAVTGITDILSFSKETYMVALETIKAIAENVGVLKDRFDYQVLSEISDHYSNTGNIPDIGSTVVLEAQARELEDQIKKLEREIIQYQSDIKALDALNLRPTECQIDSCPYIKEAVIIQKKAPKEAYERASGMLEEMKTKYSQVHDEIHLNMVRNDCISQFRNLIRDIDRNKALISKLPCGNIFADKRTLITSIFKDEYRKYFDEIYQHIYLASLFDRYKALVDTINSLESEKQIYESKQDIINEIQRDIDSINEKLAGIETKIRPIQAAIAMNDKSLIKLQGLIGAYKSIADNELARDRVKANIDANNNLYNANIEKIKKFTEAQKIAIKAAETVEELSKQISPLMHERDRLNHQMRMIDDYNRELETLNNQYNLLEKIRYYSSPTTGIQLTFMEMYMGKIIQVANELLGMFFNGQFKILPFIINESEFRIPCAGEGIVNDDISSMSSAQIAMISMILSFSFLFNSSSRYNILKLDEIDGPLDSTNRIMFLDVLNNVMNMMGTEQCIMISHNTELQSEDCDMIILKSSDGGFSDRNIIWKY